MYVVEERMSGEVQFIGEPYGLLSDAIALAEEHADNIASSGVVNVYAMTPDKPIVTVHRVIIEQGKRFE